MRTSVSTLIFIAAFFLQCAAGNLISLWGYTPDFILCSTLLSLILCSNTGIVIGTAIFTEAIRDVCFSMYPGTGSAAVFLAALIVLKAGDYFTWENPASFLLLTAAATCFYNGILWILESFFGAPYTFFYVMKLQPGYILANTALMAAVYFIFMKKRKVG